MKSRYGELQVDPQAITGQERCRRRWIRQRGSVVCGLVAEDRLLAMTDEELAALEKGVLV